MVRVRALRAIFSIIDPTIALPSPLPPPLASWAARLPDFRWPWEATTPVDALVAGGFPILVVSGGQRPMYEEISDSLATALGAERRIVPAGHAVQAAGTPFNALLEEFLARAEAAAVVARGSDACGIPGRSETASSRAGAGGDERLRNSTAA